MPPPSAPSPTPSSSSSTSLHESADSLAEYIAQRKMFVGGLCPTTTEEKIEAYFSKFGEVVQASVMRDQLHTPGPDGPRSRGFGFVIFKEIATIDKVLEVKEHLLDDKVIDPKRAMARGEAPPPKRSAAQVARLQRKIFCGGLSSEMTEDELKAYFEEKFGEVESISMVIDPVTQRSRGFAFVLFFEEEPANKARETHYHVINRRHIEVKHANPKAKHHHRFPSEDLDVYEDTIDPSMYMMSQPIMVPQQPMIPQQQVVFMPSPPHQQQTSFLPSHTSFVTGPYQPFSSPPAVSVISMNNVAPLFPVQVSQPYAYNQFLPPRMNPQQNFYCGPSIPGGHRGPINFPQLKIY